LKTTLILWKVNLPTAMAGAPEKLDVICQVKDGWITVQLWWASAKSIPMRSTCCAASRPTD